MKKLIEINNLLKSSELSKKIKIFFSTKTAGDDFDPYEQNWTYTNLNPITIKAYVRQLSPTALVWREYGLKEQGAIEIITEKRYKDWFKNANKIEIDDIEYEVFREAVNQRAIITERPYNLIRIILQQKT